MSPGQTASPKLLMSRIVARTTSGIASRKRQSPACFPVPPCRLRYTARDAQHPAAVLLADEPTGELDSTTAGQVVDPLHEVNRELASPG
jgi:predicted ABC-type transport system involved in lysophospholipase L1 biosynthesis ATPase subunit